MKGKWDELSNSQEKRLVPSANSFIFSMASLVCFPSKFILIRLVLKFRWRVLAYVDSRFAFSGRRHFPLELGKPCSILLRIVHHVSGIVRWLVPRAHREMDCEDLSIGYRTIALMPKVLAGRVTTSGITDRISVVKSQTRRVSGRSPVITETREGLHTPADSRHGETSRPMQQVDRFWATESTSNHNNKAHTAYHRRQ